MKRSHQFFLILFFVMQTINVHCAAGKPTKATLTTTQRTQKILKTTLTNYQEQINSGDITLSDAIKDAQKNVVDFENSITPDITKPSLDAYKKTVQTLQAQKYIENLSQGNMPAKQATEESVAQPDQEISFAIQEQTPQQQNQIVARAKHSQQNKVEMKELQQATAQLPELPGSAAEMAQQIKDLKIEQKKQAYVTKVLKNLIDGRIEESAKSDRRPLIMSYQDQENINLATREATAMIINQPNATQISRVFRGLLEKIDAIKDQPSAAESFFEMFHDATAAVGNAAVEGGKILSSDIHRNYVQPLTSLAETAQPFVVSAKDKILGVAKDAAIGAITSDAGQSVLKAGAKQVQEFINADLKSPDSTILNILSIPNQPEASSVPYLDPEAQAALLGHASKQIETVTGINVNLNQSVAGIASDVANAGVIKLSSTLKNSLEQSARKKMNFDALSPEGKKAALEAAAKEPSFFDSLNDTAKQEVKGVILTLVEQIKEMSYPNKEKQEADLLAKSDGQKSSTVDVKSEQFKTKLADFNTLAVAAAKRHSVGQHTNSATSASQPSSIANFICSKLQATAQSMAKTPQGAKKLAQQIISTASWLCGYPPKISIETQQLINDFAQEVGSKSKSDKKTFFKQFVKSTSALLTKLSSAIGTESPADIHTTEILSDPNDASSPIITITHYSPTGAEKAKYIKSAFVTYDGRTYKADFKEVDGGVYTISGPLLNNKESHTPLLQFGKQAIKNLFGPTEQPVNLAGQKKSIADSSTKLAFSVFDPAQDGLIELKFNIKDQKITEQIVTKVQPDKSKIVTTTNKEGKTVTLTGDPVDGYFPTSTITFDLANNLKGVTIDHNLSITRNSKENIITTTPQTTEMSYNEDTGLHTTTALFDTDLNKNVTTAINNLKQTLGDAANIILKRVIMEGSALQGLRRSDPDIANILNLIQENMVATEPVSIAKVVTEYDPIKNTYKTITTRNLSNGNTETVMSNYPQIPAKS